MPFVKDADGNLQLVDNTDTVRFVIPDSGSAIVQTFSTAASTLSAATASATVAGLTLAAVTVAASRYGYDSQTQADAIPAQIKKIIADVANAKQVLNKVVDALQTSKILS
jgi:hypothetical protein